MAVSYRVGCPALGAPRCGAGRQNRWADAAAVEPPGWPYLPSALSVRYPCGMPRTDRVSLTAGGLAMPSVDHLSNKGTLNLPLDRAFSGVPAGLPPDRTMIGLFTNFCRLTDKALREYDAARADCRSTPPITTGRYGPAPTCGRSTTWRTALAPPTAQC